MATQEDSQSVGAAPVSNIENNDGNNAHIRLVQRADFMMDVSVVPTWSTAGCSIDRISVGQYTAPDLVHVTPYLDILTDGRTSRRSLIGSQ